MSLYPSLEDMKVDQLSRAQLQLESQYYTASGGMYPSMSPPSPVPTAPLPYTLTPQSSPSSVLYPALNDYMGLEFTEEVIAANMPEYSAVVAVQQPRTSGISGPITGMIAPLSGQTLGLQRAQVTHGVRELVLCKGADGKTGIRVAAINKGIFVSFVMKGSPAAMAGLRFGDQILQISGTVVAGFSMNQVHKLFTKSPVNGISVIVRDRPFERTVTLHKDSFGTIGFNFKNGEIIGLVKDSSAARNGLLTEHNLLEVDGQNVVGLKDKEISAIIEKADRVVTVTIIPTFVYTHIMKKMAPNLVKTSMDHTVPNL